MTAKERKRSSPSECLFKFSTAGREALHVLNETSDEEREKARSTRHYLIVSFYALEGLLVESIAIVGDQRDGRVQ